MAKTINFIDLQHAKHFSYHDKHCEAVNLKDKKLPIVARLNFNDIITHNFKLERHLSPAELLVTSELKMYDEIGLDMSKAYKISYATKHASSGDLKLVESFAVDKVALEKKYQKTFSSLKHIDFLAIPFLVFETLYTNKILDKRNDLFITLDDDESFFAFYKEGAYVTSKKTLSLNDMLKELENQNIMIDLQKLKDILLTKGFAKAAYTLEEYALYDYLVKTFENFLSKTQNIAIHNRNVYGFTQVERVFFSLDGQLIPGMQDYIQSTFMDSALKPMNFFDCQDACIIDIIAASYAKEKLAIQSHEHNFTIFHKKAPFFKSEVGKFTLAACVATVLIAAYPAYQQYEIEMIHAENEVLGGQLSTLSLASSKLKKKHTALKTDIKTTAQALEKVDKDLHTLKDVIHTLLTLKSQDSKYTPMFLTVNTLLKKYKLSIDNVAQVGEGAMDFEVYSKEQKRDTIAKFMAALLNQGYTSVTSNEIKQSDEIYKSIITVKR